ncbi:MAG: DUF2357 domain-containing protein [Candidatus Faecousia sp.]|nr:DUF2357 domain-containing protein [Candidatus Faecousia sp.]
MAGTITDLYLKYVNKVGKTLENDRYFQYLFEMVQAGSTTLKQSHQVLHKVVDERWLSVIEESLDALNRITEHPRRFVTTSEELVPVELAKKISAESVRHLSQNTQFIAPSKDGDIHPTKILNVTTEETYNLYENRFIYHLIRRLVTFIDKRTDVIFWSTGDETRNTLMMQSSVDDAYEQIEYKLEMTIKNTQSFAENDSENMQVFMRIDRVRRMVMALKNSAFCDLMAGCTKVTSPIQRTNTIMKDPDYRTCFKLWQFLESYEEVGYSIEARDSALEFDEEYMIQLYSNLITNYTVFKSLLEADPRRLDEIPPKKRKVIKPKFIKQIQEQIVDDYDIPDVEVRRVIIEEVTQAQLDAEAKLEEETALRQQAEADRDDAQQALQEYRWQADFQLAEAERQAEERLNRTKEDAEAAQKALQDALDQAKAEAAQREEALKQQLEALKQSSREALDKANAASAQREAELNAQMEEAKTAAQVAMDKAQEEAAQREAAIKQQLDAAQAEARDAAEQANAFIARREAELKAEMNTVRANSRKEIDKAKEEAAQYEAAMNAKMEAARRRAKESVAHAQAQQRQAASELKSVQSALEKACQERDNAIRLEQLAQQKAKKEAAAREEAQRRAEENKFTKKLLEAVAQRREDRVKQNKKDTES